MWILTNPIFLKNITTPDQKGWCKTVSIIILVKTLRLKDRLVEMRQAENRKRTKNSQKVTKILTIQAN